MLSSVRTYWRLVDSSRSCSSPTRSSSDRSSSISTNKSTSLSARSSPRATEPNYARSARRVAAMRRISSRFRSIVMGALGSIVAPRRTSRHATRVSSAPTWPCEEPTLQKRAFFGALWSEMRVDFGVMPAITRENPLRLAKWLKTKDGIWRRGWDSNSISSCGICKLTDSTVPTLPSMPSMPWRLAPGCTRGRASRDSLRWFDSVATRSALVLAEAVRGSRRAATRRRTSRSHRDYGWQAKLRTGRLPSSQFLHTDQRPRLNPLDKQSAGPASCSATRPTCWLVRTSN